MKKVFLFIAVFLLFSVADSYGQECGTGTYTIQVLSKNKVKYSLFSITPKGMEQNPEEYLSWLEKTFSPDEKLKYRSTYYIELRVENKIAENFLKKYKTGNFEDFKNRLGSNKASATSQDGTIQFITKEGDSKLYLLKISSAGKTEYFIDNFLGGCRAIRKFEL